ncbi:MAG: polysaccharide biosynthesis/export family protein [Terriglobales bacterium]
MRHSGTIRGFGLTFLVFFVLASFSLASQLPAWSQTMPAQVPPSQTAVTPAPAAAPPSETAVTPAPVAAPSIRIGAGDLLKISVFGAPESDQEVRVDPNGNISLNFIGTVHVAGLSNDEAQDLLATKFKDGGFFAQPQVSVFTKEYATQGVSVLGEVQRPGVYPLLGSRRLFDVLSMAGGTGPKAGRIVSITHRDHPESPRNVMLSNDAETSAKSNIDIMPGDTVLVSRAGVVYVVGDVHKPSGVVMDNGTDMTVLQAIAMAEGTNPTANLNKARLIRRTPKGPQESRLLLGDMLSAKAPDVRLQAEDIIFVPNSAAKSAGKRALEAIIQSATGLAVYGARY